MRRQKRPAAARSPSPRPSRMRLEREPQRRRGGHQRRRKHRDADRAHAVCAFMPAAARYGIASAMTFGTSRFKSDMIHTATSPPAMHAGRGQQMPRSRIAASGARESPPALHALRFRAAGFRSAPASGWLRSRRQSPAAVPPRQEASAEPDAHCPTINSDSGITLAPWPRFESGILLLQLRRDGLHIRQRGLHA